MACASCHLGGGTEPGTLSLLQTAAAYPRFSGRDGGERDLVDRINGCMTRSMNGRELSRESTEMVAMVAYITSLGDIYADTDPTSLYRVKVVGLNPALLRVGKRGVQLENMRTKRRWWTSPFQLRRAYRRVTK